RAVHTWPHPEQGYRSLPRHPASCQMLRGVMTALVRDELKSRGIIPCHYEPGGDLRHGTPALYSSPQGSPRQGNDSRRARHSFPTHAVGREPSPRPIAVPRTLAGISAFVVSRGGRQQPYWGKL